jgi:vacuolar-type H+-ATPase subunit I/STV1
METEGTIIGVVFGAITGLIGKYIIESFKSKNAKIEGDIELAKVDKKHEHYENAIKELKNALMVIKDLESELANERISSRETEAKYLEELNKEKQRTLRISEKLKSIKVILKIVIKQLQAEFNTDHTKLETLRDLEQYLNAE